MTKDLDRELFASEAEELGEDELSSIVGGLAPGTAAPVRPRDPNANLVEYAMEHIERALAAAPPR
ncbi:hypothetical protein [Stappia sp. TSB10GB4]|uniref:hypothetical protein n=1 Tax=Stappia sp. TSB10GB4 TaxID=2003584 RepID=UPI001648D24C|nr:hypothetical protein [Stappia sp. TSB10GB4]